MSAPNRPGAVYALLEPIAKHGVSHVAARIAAGAHRAVGVPVLRRPGRATRPTRRSPPPCRSSAKKLLLSRYWDHILQQFIRIEMNAPSRRAASPRSLTARPGLRAQDRALHPGQAGRRARARVRARPAEHRQARVERESARPGSGGARARSPPRPRSCPAIRTATASRSSPRWPRASASPPDEIVLGNGSNDVLELVTQAFLRPGDSAVYSRHAFAVYPLATQARGATGIEVAAKDMGHDLPAMRAAITATTRIVFVANPNNPTGTWIAPAARRGVHRVGAGRRAGRARRGVQRVPRARAVRAERGVDRGSIRTSSSRGRSRRRTGSRRCASATGS